MERFGKYEVIGEIGQGGMGTIYRARDSVIGREVAIKVIQERAINNPEVRERFLREAQAAGRLSHENIMVIHDIGEQDGLPYIVMEYLRGTDLRKLLDGDVPLTLDEKLAIALQICEGLQYAHDHGVVHRDVKPDNIRILRGHRVKIMDFGIARLTDDLQTLTHASIGTPRYMSPEQVKGAKVDHRSDIFSFGVLFYELLSGSNPFWGEHVTTVIYKILHEQPEPVQVSGSRLEANLQHIVARCLEKDPDKRYQDFAALLADLSANVTTREWATRTVQLPASVVDAGIARGRGSPGEESGRGKRRRPAPIFVGAAAAVAVVLALVAFWSIFQRESSQHTADTQSERTDDRAIEDEGVFRLPDDWLDRETPPDQQAGAVAATQPDPAPAGTEAAGSTSGPSEDEVQRAEAAEAARREAAAEAARREDAAELARREEAAEQARQAELVEAARRDAAEAERRESMQAQLRSAEEARQRLRETRDGIDPSNRDAPAFLEAIVIEARGESAFGEELYADASRHFESATRLLRDLAAQPSGPSPEVLAEQAVQRLVVRLSEGFEQEDLAELRAIDPFFGTWSDFFDVAHAISARISPENLRVSGETATVQMQIDLTYMDNRNRRHRTTLRQLWTLQQAGDAWTVASVRAL